MKSSPGLYNLGSKLLTNSTRKFLYLMS